MLSVSDIFQALGGSAVRDPTFIFIGQFMIWLVLACVVVKFFTLAFGRR